MDQSVYDWMMCKAMKCLPQGNSLFDQDPLLLRRWQICFSEEGKYRAEQAEKQGKGGKGLRTPSFGGHALTPSAI